jgi:NADH-quinone oxidoreductase subunit N
MALAEVPNLLPALPEIVLALGALALLLYGSIRGETSVKTVHTGAVLVLILATLAILAVPTGSVTTFGGAFVLDGFARFAKALTFLAAAISLVMARGWFEAEKLEKFEFPILILLATTGMGMMISANDLIALYMGLELMSLSLYVVAAINRDNLRSTEAGLKYFVLGALSSGMLLYGASLVYGFTGATSFAGIGRVVSGIDGTLPLGLVFGLVFLMAGFAFKISAVPFHMWTPDVYEGAPTPVTAFFAAAPKMAAMAMLVRALSDAFGDAQGAWQQIVVFIAIASMLLGAFAAIGQRNIKRLLAYSSIGHMGFALVGLAAANQEGVQGVLVYMAIYMATSLGAFAMVLSMRTSSGMVEEVQDLAGLSKTQPLTAFFFAMLMFSLAGIPPLAGFFAKYVVFVAAIKSGLYLFAVVGVLASVVGCYYYLRIVKLMYFDEPAQTFQPMARELSVILGASAVVALGFIFMIGAVMQAAETAARSLF